MKPIRIIALLIASVTLATAAPAAPAAAPAYTIPQMEASIAAREKRTELLREEIKATDARIEARVDAIVNALTLVGDSKDSKTKVARMKSQTIEALKKNIGYYQTKRATLVEELRKPTLNLTAEQKQRGIDVFDARCEKRVAQILLIQKSLPTEKDYDRYKATGDGWYGTNYALNEDYVQNNKLSAVTNKQRDSITAGLRKSIERLEQQNRTLKSKGAPAEEIAKNDALIAERRKQLTVAIAPVETPTRQIGGKESADLDKALQTAIGDLRGEFNSLFGGYNTLIKELSALNKSRDILAAAKAKAKGN